MTILIYTILVKIYCETVSTYAEANKFMLLGFAMWLGHFVIKYLFK